MQPTADFDPVTLARSLLRRSRQGALATLAAKTGAPYCSLVNVASHPDGSPILLISRLALHTQNILADHRVSLMLDERATGDPLEGARIMLGGRAVVAPDKVLTDLSGAAGLIEAEAGAVAHMNADHADALKLYATNLLKAAAVEWRCTGLDPDGMDLVAGAATLRLVFPRRIATPGDLRKILVELATHARMMTE